MALFFFPGVGVGDDEVVEGEGAGCLRRGDQAVDGLGLSGEGVGGRTRPCRGQRDGACGVGVRAVEARAPPVGRRVVVANEPRVLVQVHALLVWHSVVGGDGVRGAVAPVPFVVGGRQGDGDVVAQQVDRVGLCVGWVAATIVGMYLFVNDTFDGRLCKPAPSAWIVVAA